MLAFAFRLLVATAFKRSAGMRQVLCGIVHMACGLKVSVQKWALKQWYGLT
jgi:hypothetical protein